MKQKMKKTAAALAAAMLVMSMGSVGAYAKETSANSQLKAVSVTNSATDKEIKEKLQGMTKEERDAYKAEKQAAVAAKYPGLTREEIDLLKTEKRAEVLARFPGLTFEEIMEIKAQKVEEKQVKLAAKAEKLAAKAERVAQKQAK